MFRVERGRGGQPHSGWAQEELGSPPFKARHEVERFPQWMEERGEARPQRSPIQSPRQDAPSAPPENSSPTKLQGPENSRHSALHPRQVQGQGPDPPPTSTETGPSRGGQPGASPEPRPPDLHGCLRGLGPRPHPDLASPVTSSPPQLTSPGTGRCFWVLIFFLSCLLFFLFFHVLGFSGAARPQPHHSLHSGATCVVWAKTKAYQGLVHRHQAHRLGCGHAREGPGWQQDSKGWPEGVPQR